MTYKELHDHISKMTEEEKSQEVAVWGEDFPLRHNCQLVKNDEDMYYNYDWGDDACCPKSMLPEEDAEDPETFLVFNKGQYYIGVNLESLVKSEIDQPALSVIMTEEDGHMQKLWEQSIQAPGLHTFDEAPAACPPGYRVPTGEEQDWLLANTEFSFDEDKKEGVFRFGDGFELRLPAAGYRYIDGSLRDQGTHGNYWLSSVSGTIGRSMIFTNGAVYTNTYYRALGCSLRCLPIEIK